MKKQLFLLIVAIVVTLTSQGCPGSKILAISGKFIGQTEVMYEIYEVHDDLSMIKKGEGISSKTFKLEVLTGARYLIKFISVTETKTLFVDTSEGGLFRLIVDFKTKDYGILKYRNNHYILTKKHTIHGQSSKPRIHGRIIKNG